MRSEGPCPARGVARVEAQGPGLRPPGEQQTADLYAETGMSRAP